MAKPKSGNGKQRLRACPVCGAPAKLEDEPFCSARCAQLDLGQWLNEGYAIPAADEEDEE